MEDSSVESVAPEHRNPSTQGRENIEEDSSSPLFILGEWQKAFGAKDVDALASLYASDAYMEVSDLSVQAYGRSSIARVLHSIMDDVPHLYIEWKNPLIGEGIVASEYEIVGGSLQGRGVAIIGFFGTEIAFDKRFLTRAAS